MDKRCKVCTHWASNVLGGICNRSMKSVQAWWTCVYFEPVIPFSDDEEGSDEEEHSAIMGTRPAGP